MCIFQFKSSSTKQSVVIMCALLCWPSQLASAQMLGPLVQDSAFSVNTAQRFKGHAAANNPDVLKDANEPVSNSKEFEARGVLKASQTAQISARLSAQIKTLPYKDGQYFKSGAVLVEFDCTRERAEAEALGYALKSLTVKHQNILELYSAGAAGELELSIASADKARAAADVKVAQTRLSDCTIYAPYSGYIQTRHVSTYNTPTVGAPLLTLIRAGTPEITLITPSAWMRWLKPNATFSFTIDETGTTHKARIIRYGASVDPVSQTIEISAKFNAAAKGALSGMSGLARFAPPASVNAKVKP